ncbi:MAG: hypothetical protein J0I32_18055 [Sphingobacteriales bacterium]|nr:hypothetical protein [Sphingobacteriales bacterium]OJV97416.1 MAG: hypothetical protein BGO52_08985 [Sphingobacteriales bacterium 44-61]
MFLLFKNIKSWAIALLPLVMLTSCATYNQQVQSYYSSLREGDYTKAAKELDKSKLLKKNRNRLLYLLERGKVCHLMGQWDSSNTYFNEADLLMETARTSAKDIALGNLLNPMMQTYKAEDFEKYLVHYYKAINYLQLGETDDALVEARRISLRTYAQEDKVGNKDKYKDDAFSLMVQGIIYEKGGDVNNAFISYRNAANVFLDNQGKYYGIDIPEQLKKDLLRTADQNGFMDELGRYERLLNTTYQKEEKPAGGELILFWENGSAPVKAQQDIWFSLFKDAGGAFFFTDANNSFTVPFDFSSGYSRDNIKLEDLRSFRVALPKYEAVAPAYTGAAALAGSQSFKLEPAEDVNNLAFATLKERMLKELSSTLTRLAIKKLAEAAIRPSDKKDNDKSKTEEQRKKEKKEEAAREAIALGLQIFNFASEKADTRNWQSLPHTIYYARIPLQAGENQINLQLSGRASASVPVKVNGRGGMQVMTVNTIR